MMIRLLISRALICSWLQDLFLGSPLNLLLAELSQDLLLESIVCALIQGLLPLFTAQRLPYHYTGV
jgi:hypothetical protein